MIWHGNARKGIVAPEDNVASALPLNYKSNSLQCFDEIPPGKVRGSLVIRCWLSLRRTPGRPPQELVRQRL